MTTFQDYFYFGVATAAHQFEGGNIHSDWWKFEQDSLRGATKKIANDEVSGIACDHWNRFDQDLPDLISLGVNAYRLSIEWARAEPKEGVFDQAVLDRYRQWIAKLKQINIEPWITLHHFTLPQWVRDKGAFENPEMPRWFSRWAEKIYTDLGDLVSHFVTINEPMVHLGGGYLTGVIPPCVRAPDRFWAATTGLLDAHSAA